MSKHISVQELDRNSKEYLGKAFRLINNSILDENIKENDRVYAIKFSIVGMLFKKNNKEEFFYLSGEDELELISPIKYEK